MATYRRQRIEPGFEPDYRALARELALAASLVLCDAALEDDYAERDSDGRFITKRSLLRMRDAFAKAAGLLDGDCA